jgi:hypothetical protein
MATIEKTTVRVREDKVKGTPAKEDYFMYSYPDTIQEAIDLYTDTVVYNIFKKQAIVLAQGVARPMLDEGKSHDDIQSFMNDWRPDVKIERTRVRTVASIPELLANWDTLDADKRAEIMALFQERLNTTTTVSAESSTNNDDETEPNGSLEDEGEQEDESETSETEEVGTSAESTGVPEEYRRGRRR